MKAGWCGENESLQFRSELKFFHLKVQRVGFLFGLFAFSDVFAERAGVFTVEGLAHRLGHVAVAKIIREHRSPRDGLEHRPMAADRRKKRGDDEQMADTT